MPRRGGATVRTEALGTPPLAEEALRALVLTGVYLSVHHPGNCSSLRAGDIPVYLLPRLCGLPDWLNDLQVGEDEV